MVRSSKVAPEGASGARTRKGPDKSGLKVHLRWYKANEEQAKALQEKVRSGADLTNKEREFLSWWAGYTTVNPDPKKVPRPSPSVILRDRDPMV